VGSQAEDKIVLGHRVDNQIIVGRQAEDKIVQGHRVENNIICSGEPSGG
jgi:hypothetical protein